MLKFKMCPSLTIHFSEIANVGKFFRALKRYKFLIVAHVLVTDGERLNYLRFSSPDSGTVINRE